MLAVLLAMCLLTVTGCSRSTEQNSNTSPFIYYASVSVTGAVAAFTAAEIGGFQLAVDKINNEGGINGRKVELVVQNDTNDPTTAVSLLQKYLASGKKPDVVYAGSSSAVVLSLLPVLAAKKIVSLTPPNSKAVLDHPDKFPYGFGTVVASGESAGFFVKEAQAKGYKKVAMLYADSATGQGSFAAFDEAFKAAGIQFASASYKETSLDMTPQLQKLQAENPDALILNGYGAPTLYVFKSRAQLGWNLPTYADTLASSFPLAKSLPADSLKNVKVQVSSPSLETSQHQDGLLDFIATVKASQYKEQFPTYGFGPYTTGWDSVMLARAVMTQAGGSDADKVKAYLEAGSFKKPTKDLLGQGKDASAIEYCWSKTTHFPCVTSSTFIYVNPPTTDDNGFYVVPAAS
jgi:branched-chain amino acid transport system substrate-binding protein